jgi:DNA gyrase subunit A
VELDQLIDADITDGHREIMLFTNAGKVIRFLEDTVRPMGRTARGVRGIRLKKNQRVVSLIVLKKELPILTATEHGYGKRTELSEYRMTNRGGQGVISIQVTKRNGNVIGAIQAGEDDEIMLISDQGTLVRTRVNEVSIIGRNTQGVKLIDIADNEKLIGIEKIEME